MTLVDKLKPYYAVNMRCSNCGKDCELKIKKGITVKEASMNKKITCDNCGCLIESFEYTTKWIK